MSHDHHHHDHSHEHVLREVNTAYVVGIILNVAFLVVEVIAALSYNSLALVSDAGHNLADISGLIISLVAFRMMRIKPAGRFTYGYRKASILASLLNAILLLVTVIGIVYEGVIRLQHPEPVTGSGVGWIALAGLTINGISAFLFFRTGHQDINVRGAYLHLLADAAVSLGVIAAGFIIHFTGWVWVDTVTSFGVALVILLSTWRLLKESIVLVMDGVPASVNLEKIQAIIRARPGVNHLHHVHIWAMSSSQVALTAHVVVAAPSDMETVRDDVRHALEHAGIGHVTLEMETSASRNPCSEATGI